MARTQSQITGNESRSRKPQYTLQCGAHDALPVYESRPLLRAAGSKLLACSGGATRYSRSNEVFGSETAPSGIAPPAVRVGPGAAASAAGAGSAGFW